jgi:hypothetical protein
MLSLKKQALFTAKYFSLNNEILPISLQKEFDSLKKCCYSYNLKAAKENDHEACAKKAKLQQQACCCSNYFNYFSIAVWNDHHRCAERISRECGVEQQLFRNLLPNNFIGNRVAIKYCLTKNTLNQNALAWSAMEGDFETFKFLLKWGLKPTDEIMFFLFADILKQPSNLVAIQTTNDDYCARPDDVLLSPKKASAKQAMRKMNAICFEALLHLYPENSKYLKSILVHDNLQCLAVLYKLGVFLPNKLLKVAVRWDSIACLEFLVKVMDVDNSLLGFAIQSRSFKCSKFLFQNGFASDLALYYSVKYRCFQLLKWFSERMFFTGGIEILRDDCNFLKTAVAVDCLFIPSLQREKVENFFQSDNFEQFKINQQLAFCGNGNFIDVYSLLKNE